MKLKVGNTGLSDTKIVYADDERIITIFKAAPGVLPKHNTWYYVRNIQLESNFKPTDVEKIVTFTNNAVSLLNITARLTS